MYELNGKQYTLEQIEAILNKEKYKGSADDFIAERGYTKVSTKQKPGSSIQEVGEEVKKRENIVAEEKKQIELAQAEVDAAGPIELEEVVLKPEDQQTVSLKENEDITTAGLTPAGKWLEKNNEPYLEKIKQRQLIDKRIKELGNPDFFITQASFDLRNNLIEQRLKLDEELIPFEDGRKMSVVQSIKNAFMNSAKELNKVGSFYSGESAGMDIATSRIYEGIFGDAGELPDKWIYEGIGDKEVEENLEKLKKEVDSFRGTINITDALSKGEFGRAAGGVLSSIIGAVGSVGYGALTLGSGYFFDFAAQNWMEYNEGKAARLGITLEELVEQNLDETGGPIRRAAAMSALEYFGFTKILGSIFKPKGSKGKMLTGLLGTGVAESITEFGQCEIEVYNRVLGETGNKQDAMKAARNAALGDCTEAAVQGFFSGAGIATAGTVRTADTPQIQASSNIRTIEQTQNLNNDLEKIGSLRKKAAQTKDPTVKAGIEAEAFNLENKVKVEIGRNNQIVNVLTDQELNTINKLGKSANSTLDQFGTLLTKFRNKEITQEEFNAARKGFQEKYEADKNAINEIKEQASSKVTAETPIILSMFMSGVAKPTADQKIEAEVLADKGEAQAEIALDEVVVTAKDKSTANELARNYDNLEAKDVETLLDQYRSIALSALGYSPGKGTVTPEDAQAFVDAEFTGIMERFDPNEAQFSTFVTNTIAPKAASLYGGQEGLAEAGKTTSLDDERAQQVADPSTVQTVESVTTETVTPTINVFGKGPEAEVLESQTVGAIQESELGRKIQSAETIEISDLNTLNEEVSAPILAEELNIPVEVITDPKLNINDKHNPSNIQRFILRNAQTVLGVLKANTNVEVVGSLKNPEVKIKVGGKPLKLPRKLLDLFFDKTDIRVGNNFQYKLKPNLTIKDIQMSVGILDGKVDPDFINRSGEAQTAKAILTLLSRVRTNAALEGITTGEVAGTILSATPEKVKTAVDRAIDYLKGIEGKYSGTLGMNITPGPVAKVLRVGLQTFQSVYNKTKDFAKALSAFIKKVISGLKITNAEEKKIVADVLTEYVKVDNIDTVDLDNMINDLVNKLNISRGIAYEKVVYKNAEGITSPIFKVTGTQTEKGKAPDIQFEIAGQKFDIETKLSNPQYSSVNGTYNFEDLVFNYSSTSLAAMGSEFKIEADKLLEKAKPALKNYYDKAKELGVNLKTSGTSMPRVVFDQLGRKGFNLQTEITQRVQLDEKIIEELYNSKGVYYIQIKGKGLYYMGENPLNLPIPKLEGDVTLTLRIARSQEDKNGNVRPILRFFPDDIKITSPKSNFSIDTKAGIESLLNTEAVKELAVSAEAKQEADNVLEDGKKALETPKVQKELDKINEEENSKDLSKDFNTIIEDNKGIKAEAVYSDIAARREGRGKGRFKFFLPPGAEDFKGLVYTFLGKGKIGEKQFEFFDNNLIKPYQQAVAQIERFRRTLKLDYSTLLKASPEARVLLNKKIPTKGKTDFTYDQAVRAYLMDQSGFNLSEAGLSKRDAKLLVDTIKNDPIMASFAQGLQLITKQDTWLSPNAGFDVQTIQSDLHRLTSGEGRKRFLDNSGFMQNSSEIFSKDNLNKIEATYGRGVREAIEDMMYRMKNGTNRPSGNNRLTNQFNNWVNRSIGAIMFFNRKSALLQTISSINFINWSDNNPLKAAAAFANQKQYWSDFARIFNSAKLKERRAGLKGDINEAELASAVKGATNKAEAALSWLLKQGFLPTQMADSFAIASGGASFYRNRINTYKKQGLSDVEAEKKAFEDFSRISEESQQSADPSMISEQQASPLGRLILAFQNTPMQYTRLMKRAAQDLVAGRGDAKTHISKIIYYGAVQNFMFSALQNALFAVIPGFDDEEETLEEENKKQQANQNKNVRIVNNMVDTVLRGSGIYGAIGATLKNTIIKFYQNEQKDPFAKDNADIILEAINLSPPIGSKLRKINNALKTREYEKDVIEERGWEITRDGRLNLSPSYRVLGSTAEAVANIPLERLIAEIGALTEMTDSRNTSMERIALALGWRTWDLGIRNEEEDQIKVEAKEKRKREKQEQRKREREEKKRLEEEARFKGLSNKEINNLKRRDQIEALTKQQQIDSLLKLGVSKKDIRSLRLESDRIDKIIEINTK